MDPIVIIGCGPAGAAALLELSRHGVPAVALEAGSAVGGLSRTAQFHGALFDVGPHRFFTTNLEIRALWEDVLGDDFLEVDRLTRIFYTGKFLSYPVSVQDILHKLGLPAVMGFLLSYAAARTRSCFSTSEPSCFEDWVVAQFGRKLFRAFFKTYTEKVWGIPCTEISADWAGQRIKGLSLTEVMRNALFKPQNAPKTLLDRFRFPRQGAGMMYERMIEAARRHGGEVLVDTRATEIRHEDGRAVAVIACARGKQIELPCAHVVTSNPLTEMATSLRPMPPAPVREAAAALRYRCHLGVNLLVEGDPFPDNWVYVHSEAVALGRVANYANFSREMRDPDGLTPLTVEYFQFPEDPLYRTEGDSEVIEVAQRELRLMGLLDPDQVRGGFVVRSPRAYPLLQIGHAPKVHVLRQYLAGFPNIHPIGRAGMFKYNNQDHSIATGLLAARNIMGARHDVWAVNIDAEYHEAGRA